MSVINSPRCNGTGGARLEFRGRCRENARAEPPPPWLGERVCSQCSGGERLRLSRILTTSAGFRTGNWPKSLTRYTNLLQANENSAAWRPLGRLW